MLYWGLGFVKGTGAVIRNLTFLNHHLQVFSDVLDPLVHEYHGISPVAVHTSDKDVNKIKSNIYPSAPVSSTHISVGRSIDAFCLSPGMTKEQRI